MYCIPDHLQPILEKLNESKYKPTHIDAKLHYTMFNLLDYLNLQYDIGYDEF